MTYKKYKAIMIGYAENHAIDTYKLYNPGIKRVITKRDVKWEEWKMTYPSENLEMFRDQHEEYLIIYID